MLNMSTMSHIKMSITVFQEQQNGETNTLGAPDYLQALLSNLWRLMTKVI